MIGHGERFYPRIIHGVDQNVLKPLGAWMRAGSRRAAPMSGQCWVALESTVDRQKWKSPAMEADAAIR